MLEEGKVCRNIKYAHLVFREAGGPGSKNCTCVHIAMEVLWWIECCHLWRNLAPNLWDQIIGPDWCSILRTPKGLLIQLKHSHVAIILRRLLAIPFSLLLFLWGACHCYKVAFSSQPLCPVQSRQMNSDVLGICDHSNFSFILVKLIFAGLTQRFSVSLGGNSLLSWIIHWEVSNQD